MGVVPPTVESVTPTRTMPPVESSPGLGSIPLPVMVELSTVSPEASLARMPSSLAPLIMAPLMVTLFAVGGT